MLPVYGPNRELYGCVLRSLTGQTPKVLTHTDQGAMAWYTNVRNGDIIIVEDQLSAIRASAYLTSVALLGTMLNEDRVARLRSVCRGKVYMALDNDAIGTAVRHLIKYRSFLPVSIIRLEKDIKDMTHEEADNLFAGIDAARV